MAMNRREQLLREYLEALDTNDPDRMEAIISEDFTYRYLDRVFEGKAATLRFLREEREVDSEHDFETIVHGLHHSVGIGSSHGVGPEGAFESDMCDVFTFDEEESMLTSVTIYTR
jgi:ketosteroid isomerase-like protein